MDLLGKERGLGTNLSTWGIEYKGPQLVHTKIGIGVECSYNGTHGERNLTAPIIGHGIHVQLQEHYQRPSERATIKQYYST